MDRGIDASLKLLGGALRLGDFTARELAEHANIKLETARAFVDDRHRSGLFQQIERVRMAPEGDNRGGRPANRYRVHPERRGEVLRRLVEIRRELRIEMPVASPSIVGDDPEDFSPLALVDTTLDLLAEYNFEQPDERQNLFEEARIRLRGAEEDFRELAIAGDTAMIERYAVRLAASRERLAQCEQADPHVPWYGLLDWVVAHLSSLRQRARQLTQNPSSAEDLVQASLAEALYNRHQVKANTDLTAWFHRFQDSMLAKHITRQVLPKPAAEMSLDKFWLRPLGALPITANDFSKVAHGSFTTGVKVRQPVAVSEHSKEFWMYCLQKEVNVPPHFETNPPSKSTIGIFGVEYSAVYPTPTTVYPRGAFVGAAQGVGMGQNVVAAEPLMNNSDVYRRLKTAPQNTAKDMIYGFYETHQKKETLHDRVLQAIDMSQSQKDWSIPVLNRKHLQDVELSVRERVRAGYGLAFEIY